MFLNESSAAGHAGIPDRLRAILSSNRRVRVDTSSLGGSKTERVRKPSRAFSSVVPIDPSSAATLSVTQESLFVEALGVQVGTTGGAAAELAGKAIKPTPKAAVATTRTDRFSMRGRSRWRIWRTSRGA